MSRVRFGVLGCADIAWRRTMPALAADPDVDLVAVASRERAKAEAFAARFSCSPVTGYQDLLDRDDVDAVYVPLPARLHAEWIERALLAGKHVLAEKPLVTSAKEAEHLFGLARGRGLVLLENFMFLHHSQHEAVRQVAAERIGELRSFAASFTIPPKPPGDMRHDPVSGGALFEIGVYPIRAAQLFLGGGLEAVGAVLRLHRGSDVVTSGAVQLVRPDGVSAHLTFGMEHSYRNDYELTGSTGRLSLDRAFTPPETHRPVVRVERQDHVEMLTLRADHQFANVVHAFATAVRMGVELSDAAEASRRHAVLVDEIAEKAVVRPFD